MDSFDVMFRDREGSVSTLQNTECEREGRSFIVYVTMYTVCTVDNTVSSVKAD